MVLTLNEICDQYPEVFRAIQNLWRGTYSIEVTPTDQRVKYITEDQLRAAEKFFSRLTPAELDTVCYGAAGDALKFDTLKGYRSAAAILDTFWDGDNAPR